MSELWIEVLRDHPELSYIPAHTLLDISRVMVAGASKEGRFKDDWIENTTPALNREKAMSHLFNAGVDGQNIDADGGEYHLANAAARILMALHQIKAGKNE